MEETPPGGFIDLHCHILPGVDDGPGEMATALAMARMAVAEGTGTLLATPHFKADGYEETPEKSPPIFQQLVAALAEEGIALQLGLAAEVHLGAEIFGWLRKGRVPWLNRVGERRYLLLEFPFGGVEPGQSYMTELLVKQGITPILAHPERIRDFRKDPDRLGPFLKMGCLTQITAGSLSGQFGEGVRQTAETILERGWVTVLASDGHHIYRRQPVLSDGFREAAKLIGRSAALRLVTTNPQAILAGEGVCQFR
ncbi:MAG: capsular biosynthesis protein [Magnetococcales bacterium]|nr:capsular biosynthesis protein [Magnetococcales bacterium]